MNENQLSLRLAPGVELVAYTRDQSCGVEVLETNGLLEDYEAAMARIEAGIRAEPDAVQIWVDILPAKCERLIFAITMIYFGGSDCRGALAAAQYSATAEREAASAILYRWSEQNALNEIEHFLESRQRLAG